MVAELGCWLLCGRRPGARASESDALGFPKEDDEEPGSGGRGAEVL